MVIGYLISRIRNGNMLHIEKQIEIFLPDPRVNADGLGAASSRSACLTCKARRSYSTTRLF